MGSSRRRVTGGPRLAVLLLAWMSSTGCAPSPAEAPLPDCPPARLAEILQGAGEAPPATSADADGRQREQAPKPRLPLGQAERRALRRPPLGSPTLAPDDPLLLHAETLVDGLDGPSRAASLASLVSINWSHLRILGNTWLAEAASAPTEQATRDLRRATRLGSLLVSETADFRQDIGLEILAAVAALEPSALQSAALSGLERPDLESELEAQRQAIRTVRGRCVELYCRLVERLEPWWEHVGEERPSLTGTEIAWLRERAACGPWRGMRLTALAPLRALTELGDLAQRQPARELLQRLAADPDPLVAAEARRLLDDPDAVTPCIGLLGE